MHDKILTRSISRIFMQIIKKSESRNGSNALITVILISNQANELGIGIKKHKKDGVKL